MGRVLEATFCAGSITGAVKDSSGVSVPGAAVTVVNPARDQRIIQLAGKLYS